MTAALAMTSNTHADLMTHWNDLQTQQAAVVAAAKAAGAAAAAAAASASAAAAAAPSPAQLAILRGLTAPRETTALFERTPPQRKPPQVLRATVVSTAAAAAEAVAVPAPVAAHVLTDVDHVAEQDIAKRLQMRLATLGLGASMIRVDVRPCSPAPASSSTGSASSKFALTLTGRCSIALGSLFNMVMSLFLRQHPQVVTVERRVTFFAAERAALTDAAALAKQRLARSSTGSVLLHPSPMDEDTDKPSLDSPPILQLKVKHLARLLASSSHTVVFAGEQLCDAGAQLQSASTLAALSTPHPPALLAEWVREGTIAHIVSESTDGLFNPPARPTPSSSAPQSMNDDSSVCSDEDSASEDSDESDALPQPPRMLGPELLSELYGNKFIERCSAGCINGAAIVRDFEVARRNLPPLMRACTGVAAATAAFASDPHHTGRVCPHCHAPLRDTLVGWNESIPRDTLQRSVGMAAEAELSLVLGSRLRSSPMVDLPCLAAQSNARAAVALVHPCPTDKDVACLEAGGILLRGAPSTVLALLQSELHHLQSSQQNGKAATVSLSKRVSSASAPLLSRPIGTQLASGLVKRDLKRRLSGSTVVAPNSAAAAILAQCGQRRGSAVLSSRLSKPLITRAATAGPQLLSTSAGLSMPRNLRGISFASVSLPPFPRLDADEDEEDSQQGGGAAPASVSLSRPSSVMSGRITAMHGGDDSMMASLMLPLTPLPPSLSIAPAASGSLLPAELSTPTLGSLPFHSLTPPPSDLTSMTTPQPMLPPPAFDSSSMQL